MYVICDAGILSARGSGIFTKRMHVNLVPWSEIAEIAQTEPTLRVYSGESILDLTYSGGGSANDLAEWNRIYGYLPRGLDRAVAR